MHTVGLAIQWIRNHGKRQFKGHIRLLLFLLVSLVLHDRSLHLGGVCHRVHPHATSLQTKLEHVCPNQLARCGGGCEGIARDTVDFHASTDVWSQERHGLATVHLGCHVYSPASIFDALVDNAVVVLAINVVDARNCVLNARPGNLRLVALVRCIVDPALGLVGELAVRHLIAVAHFSFPPWVLNRLSVRPQKQLSSSIRLVLDVVGITQFVRWARFATLVPFFDPEARPSVRRRGIIRPERLVAGDHVDLDDHHGVPKASVQAAQGVVQLPEAVPGHVGRRACVLIQAVFQELLGVVGALDQNHGPVVLQLLPPSRKPLASRLKNVEPTEVLLGKQVDAVDHMHLVLLILKPRRQGIICDHFGSGIKHIGPFCGRLPKPLPPIKGALEKKRVHRWHPTSGGVVGTAPLTISSDIAGVVERSAGFWDPQKVCLPELVLFFERVVCFLFVTKVVLEAFHLQFGWESPPSWSETGRWPSTRIYRKLRRRGHGHGRERLLSLLHGLLGRHGAPPCLLSWGRYTPYVNRLCNL